ncbi:hypothetical protein [Micrococcus luteus]|uniref:hypothetical protein n=1 Tax=Micrococcus luteus TaxID=1270 RepID=UPI003321AB6D
MTESPPEELRVRKISYFAPISEELLMEYGLIPDTRPAPPPPPWHRRLCWTIARFRLRLGAWIAGVRPEEWEDGWI